MYNQIIFYISAIFTVLFALLAIKFDNIFYSLLSAIVVFISIAAIFFTAGSEYNAIIQFAVYGFAIPVILGITIMFTTLKGKTENSSRNKWISYILFLLGGIFLIALIYLVLISFVTVPNGFNINSNSPVSGNSIPIFADGIFKKYVWGFELISLVITIAAIGLTIFKKEVKD